MGVKVVLESEAIITMNVTPMLQPASVQVIFLQVLVTNSCNFLLFQDFRLAKPLRRGYNEVQSGATWTASPAVPYPAPDPKPTG